jgi:hypothetical protein
MVVDLGRQTTHGCGDLIFSSHTTFALVGVLTYTEYGGALIVKLVTWVAVFVLSVLIVASRKHYTVDVVVAWYVVPLVFYAMHRRWTTKRPIQDEWPHRPLAEDTELAEVVVDDQSSKISEVNGKQGGKQPLLPAVVSASQNKGASSKLPLPSDRPHPGTIVVKGHAQAAASGKQGPGTPRDDGGNGSSRKSPSTIMRPRSMAVIMDTGRPVDDDVPAWSDDWNERTEPSRNDRNTNSGVQLGPTAPACTIS